MAKRCKIWLSLFRLLLAFGSLSAENGLCPRPSNLVAFWPLDGESGLGSIVGNAQTLVKPGDPILQERALGPFNTTQSSYSVAKNASTIGSALIAVNDSFTISLFVYLAALHSDRRGIFEQRLETASGTLMFCRFCVTFEKTALKANTLKLWSNGKIIHQFDGVTALETWNFFAFTYEPGLQVLSFYYSVNGSKVEAISPVRLPSFDSQSRFLLGRANVLETDANFYPNDAMACVLVYNVSLTSFEIAGLPSVCRTKGQDHLQGTMPRPWALAAFWPFDGASGLVDIAYNRKPANGSSGRLETLRGPFGQVNSSFSTDSKGRSPLLVQDEMNVESAFTISFYIFISSTSSGSRGLISLLNNTQLFVVFNEPNHVEIRDNNGAGVNTSYPIAKKGAWNFFAFVFGKNGQLSVYHGDRGTDVESTGNAFQGNVTANKILFGFAEINDTSVYKLLNGDAMACAVVYREALTSFEISQLITACKTKGKTKLQDPLPRPESLALFLPLDGQSDTRDVAYNNQNKDLSGLPSLFSDSAGPTGTFNSAYTVGADGKMIIGYRNIFIESNFTISFWFRSPISGSKDVAIASLLRHFSITYSPPNLLQLWNGFTNPKLLAALPALQRSTWAFFAFTYDSFRNVLDVYIGEEPRLMFSIGAVEFGAFSGAVYAGMYQWSTATGYMKAGDALTCLMVYASRLTSCEIADLPRVCRQKENGIHNVVPQCPESSNVWPRPDSLVAFWPLDAASQALDVAYQRKSETGGNSIRIRNDLPGPFGITGTSASGSADGAGPPVPEDIAAVSNIAVAPTLTLSFYYRSALDHQNAIFSLDKGLGFIYRTEGHETMQIVYKSGEEVVEITRLPVVPLKQWMFFAVTYDKAKRVLQVFNETASAVGTIRDVDVQTSTDGKFQIGYSCGATSQCGFIRSADALACVMLYNAVLSPPEIAQLPYVCQTKGRGRLSRAAIPEDIGQSYEDILPTSRYIKRALSTLVYNNSNPGTFKTWSSLDGGEIKGGVLTNPRNQRLEGAIQGNRGLSKPDWRIELEFGIKEYVTGQLSRFAVIVAPNDTMADHISIFKESSNYSRPVSFVYGGVPVLVVGQHLPVGNNVGRQFIGVGDDYRATVNKNLDCTTHCAFTQPDLISGVKMVLQAIENRLTVTMYSRLQRLPGTCIDNVDISGISKQIMLNGSTVAPVTIAIVGSNKYSGVEGDGQHCIIIKEVKVYEFTGLDSGASEIEPATTTDIDSNLLPLPPGKKANLWCDYSFVDVSSFNRTWDHTVFPDVDSSDYSRIFLNASQLPPKSTYLWSRKQLKVNGTNWRMEIKLSATLGEMAANDSWLIEFSILRAGLNTFFDDMKRLHNASGFSLPIFLGTRAEIGYRFSPVATPIMQTRQVCDGRCSVSEKELANGVRIGVQSFADQISISLVRTGQKAATNCLTNYDVTGLAKLISTGKTIVALSLPVYLGGGQPIVKISEFRFFSIADDKTDPADTSCLLPVPRASTTTSTYAVTTRMVTEPPTTPAPGPQVLKKAEVSIVDSMVPAMPPETTVPMKADAVLEACDDFSSSRSVPPNRGEPTQVQFAYQVNKLVEINNVDETISIDGIIVLSWNVTTCPANSSSVFTRRREKLYVASTSQMWTPKVRFTTSASSNFYMKGDLFSDDLTAFVVSSPDSATMNLQFFYILEGLFVSRCELDLTKFPYDEQTCRLKFQFIRPVSVLEEIDPPIFEWFEELKTSEWSLKGYKAKRNTAKFVGSKVHGVELNITLKRLPDYYIVNLAFPSGMLAIIDLTTFLMPPDMPDRPVFTVTTLLALIVAQADVRRELPKKADRVLLGEYITALSFYSAAITIYEILAIFYTTSYHGHRPAGGIFRRSIAVDRIIDVIAFLPALAGLIAIHAYSFYTMLQ